MLARINNIMSMYPIFIPVLPGGGGGGPKELCAMLGVAVAIGAGYMYYYDRQFKPQVDLSIKYDKYNTDKFVNVNTKEPRFPDVKKRENHNTECLLSKGYRIMPKNKRKLSSHKTYNICSLSKTEGGKDPTKSQDYLPIDKQQFLEDCKACNVYTEVHYKSTTILGNKKLVKKNLMWHEHFEDRLE